MVRAFAHGVMGVFGSILHGEPIELFLVPASARSMIGVTKVFSCAYKRTLAANRKE